MIEEIKMMLNEVDYGKQTTFQNVYFVVEKSGITVWGKYCQTMRELSTRIDDYKRMIISIEKTKIKLERCERKQPSPDDLINRENYIEVVELSDEIEQINKQMLILKIDIESFYKMGKICRDFIIDNYGEITDELKNKLEQKYWFKKFRSMAAFDVMTRGHIGTGLWENIMSLPTGIKQSLLLDLSPQKINNTIDICIKEDDELLLTKNKIENMEINMIPIQNVLKNIDKKYFQIIESSINGEN